MGIMEINCIPYQKKEIHRHLPNAHIEDRM